MVMSSCISETKFIPETSPSVRNIFCVFLKMFVSVKVQKVSEKLKYWLPLLEIVAEAKHWYLGNFNNFECRF